MQLLVDTHYIVFYARSCSVMANDEKTWHVRSSVVALLDSRCSDLQTCKVASAGIKARRLSDNLRLVSTLTSKYAVQLPSEDICNVMPFEGNEYEVAAKKVWPENLQL